MQYDETTGALRIADLIAGYLNGQLNADEENELFTWVGLNNYNADTFIKIVDEGNLEKYRDELFTYNTVAALEKVKARLSEATIRDIKPKRKWYIPAAAAAVFILFSAVIFLYLNKPSKPQIAQHYKNDVAPGGNKAILTLANGSQISLTDAKNGKLALQGSTTISKTGSGRIVYNPANTPSQPAVAYNTITTPRGGQYQLILPDGTKVWLNAASSLKYPTAFAAIHEPRSERKNYSAGPSLQKNRNL